MRHYILVFACVFSLVSLNAQNSTDYFRYWPAEQERASAPDWAQAMYSEDPFVPSVVNSYEAYFAENPFAKTIHTQNYKHWTKTTFQWISEEGYLREPSEKERLQQEKDFRKKRNFGNRMGDTWTSKGPFITYKNGTTQSISHHTNVYCLALSQSNADRLIAGTEGGGVFLSDDNGDSWNLITKSEDLSTVVAVQINPTDANEFLLSANSSIYRSTDAGTTWTMQQNIGGSCYEFKYDPSDNSHILAAAHDGLYESDDSGDTWTQIITDRCWDVDFHTANAQKIYALVENTGLKRAEFFKSTDNGTSWNLEDNGWYSPEDPANASAGGGKIGVSELDTNRVYVALIGASKEDDNGWIGLYKSTNEGDNWTLPSGQIGGPYDVPNTMPWNAAAYTSGYHQGFYNFDLEVSSKNPDLLWFGTVRLNESSDGGLTYQGIGAANSSRLSDIHADIQAIEVLGNEVWVTSDGGINLSTDKLQSHVAKNQGITGQDFWGFAVGWNEDVYVGGKYHNGNSAHYEVYGDGIAHHVGGVEEATGYVNPQFNQRAYFNQYWSGYMNSFYIPDSLGGSTSNFSPKSLIPNETYLESYSSGYSFHPSYSGIIYAGKDSSVYKSIDGGAKWEALHSFAGGRTLGIEISRDNPNVLYCAFQPGGGYWDNCVIYRSDDAGLSWTQTTNIPTNRWRQEITLNPENEQEIWVSSNNGSNGNKVYQSLDGGTTWLNKTTAMLDGEHIHDILYQDAGSELVYVVTKYNVFYYDPVDSDWHAYSDGLPFQVRPLRLLPFFRDSELRLGTYGRGVWEAPLANPIESVLAYAMTYSDTVYCISDSVQLESYSIVDHAGLSYEWTVTPAPVYISSANARNPVMVLGDTGSYDVELMLTDSLGVEYIQMNSDMITAVNRCGIDTIPGYAMETYAGGDYAIASGMNLNNVDGLTLSAWIKPDGFQNAYSGIMMFDNPAGLNFREGNNTLGYHWPGGGQWWWDSNLEVPSGEWSHVAMVYTPTSITLYLNGVASTHNINLGGVDLSQLRMGSYVGWGGRNFVGQLDEVAVWNRALNQNEIRQYRHLTKEDLMMQDTSLVHYYQFNERLSTVYDKVSSSNASILNDATWVTSSAPLGGGVSESADVSTAGLYVFDTVGAKLNFMGDTIPDGQIWLSRINLLPFERDTNSEQLSSYWILNNYGINDTFSAITNIEFDEKYSSPSYEARYNSGSIRFVSRWDNSDDSTWQVITPLDSITENEYYSASEVDLNTSFQLFLRSVCPVFSIITTDILDAGYVPISVLEYIEDSALIDETDILFQAGEYIKLDAGFEIKLGSILSTEFSPCEH